MLTREDVKGLIDRGPQPDGPVLSVYLATDSADATSLNGGIERAFDAMLRSIEHSIDVPADRQQFASDAERVRRFLRDYVPHGRGLVVFSDHSTDFFWWRALQTQLANDAYWSPAPHVRPLLEALDEYERYGVILTDRSQARLFTVFMGEIAEHHEALAAGEVHHTKTSGTDRIWSQSHFQKRADAHARSHLKHVAELAGKMADARTFDRFVLAGRTEATAELERLLPKRVRSRVVATVALGVDASEHEVLEVTLELERGVEREQEIRLVDTLITSAAKNEQAVMGIEGTLQALQEGRVRQLVYAEDQSRTGARCTACPGLFAAVRESCGYCGATLAVVGDLLEILAERTIAAGGSIEEVRGEAALALSTAGGVAAFLRF